MGSPSMGWSRVLSRCLQVSVILIAGIPPFPLAQAQSVAPLFPVSPPPTTPPPTITPPEPLPILSPSPLPGGTFEEISTSFWELNRAKNLARQAAELANGGLQNYRAEAAMYGATADAPFVDQGTHWVFTFRGGSPGFVEPTIESEIRVDKGSFRTTVLYNGSLRL
ncbi:MAG: hypothetical protein NW237_13165 [Cyanobacteriota bacterium]|nr:hypothetical protein [Cyanobacteriota bacterium]